MGVPHEHDGSRYALIVHSPKANTHQYIVNIGNARLFGMEDELGMHGNDFQLTVSVLFVTYCVRHIPYTYLDIEANNYAALRVPLQPHHQEAPTRSLPRWSHSVLGYHRHLQRLGQQHWCPDRLPSPPRYL